MNRKVKIYVCFSVLLLIVAVIPALVQAQILPLKLCCIAGNYEGTHKPNAEPNCPVPKSEVFYMTIKQGKGCSADVWGTITDIAGVVQNFTGTLTHSRIRGCCVLKASFGAPGHVTKITGTFCMRLGKWRAKGTYKEVDGGSPCRHGGTWEMKQI
ncbi:MAG: hypothetical protein MUP71_07655 [Candidatus Aminicenantes bacterium]|nr:hypothetical protein [Candidatus Aminicenantes bacterium]